MSRKHIDLIAIEGIPIEISITEGVSDVVLHVNHPTCLLRICRIKPAQLIINDERGRYGKKTQKGK